VYAWSLFNTPLTRELGVVVAAADDWQLKDVMPTFSCAIVSLGLSAAVAGKWLEKVGPRLVGVVGRQCIAVRHNLLLRRHIVFCWL
jgi:hypothetical protein